MVFNRTIQKFHFSFNHGLLETMAIQKTIYIDQAGNSFIHAVQFVQMKYQFFVIRVGKITSSTVGRQTGFSLLQTGLGLNSSLGSRFYSIQVGNQNIGFMFIFIQAGIHVWRIYQEIQRRYKHQFFTILLKTQQLNSNLILV